MQWENENESSKDYDNGQKWFDMIADGAIRYGSDESFTLHCASPSFYTLVGYTPQELAERLQNSYLSLLDERDRNEYGRERHENIVFNQTMEKEYRLRHKDGKIIWMLEKGCWLQEDGQSLFSGFLVDITSAKEKQKEIEQNLERYKMVIEQTNDIVFEWDAKTDSLQFFTSWQKKFGYSPVTEQISQQDFSKLHIYPEDAEKLHRLLRFLQSGFSYQETEIRILKGKNAYIWCKVRASALYHANGQLQKVIGMIVDVDAEKRQSQKLMEKAERDALTGLYNKITTQNLIEDVLAGSHQQQLHAFFILDLDNFKQVNDTYGHLLGDALLTDIAKEIQALFRNSDIFGRIGGDEFIIFMKDIKKKEIALQKAQSVMQSVSQMVVDKKKPLPISCSIGLSFYPQHSEQFYALYQKADYALYRAKMQGKNQYTVYEDSIEDEMFGQLSAQYFSMITAQIDSEENTKILNSKLVEYVFRILYKSMDMEAAVNSILEIVGRQFDVSRAYIFENSEDNRFCNNTFEWCNEGISAEIDNLQRLAYGEDLDDYEEHFNHNNVFYCNDIRKLPPKQFAILDNQGIKAVLQCAIFDEGRFCGFVGFDDCEQNRYWTQEQVDTLSFIAEIVSTFLMKKRAQESEKRLVQDFRTLLDNQNSWVYVVDRESLRMLYINKKIMQDVPHACVGKPCYQVFSQRSTPCANCPALVLNEEKPNDMREIYNPFLQAWWMMDASLLSWQGQPAILLTCYDITEYKKA